MKKRDAAIYFIRLLISFLLLSFLTACGKDDVPDPTETTNDGPTTLWVVTENTERDGIKGQIREVIKKFEKEHKNVEIKLEILPAANAEERDAYLDQLRVQIMAGKGPDVFLLPVESNIPVNERYYRVEMLFSDVALAMRNGLFYDISEYYDADETLGKEALKTEVMDAGVVEGSRYVLPLRYDIPVVYANTERVKAAGVDMEAVRSGVIGYMDTVLGAAGVDLGALRSGGAGYQRSLLNADPPVLDSVWCGYGAELGMLRRGFGFTLFSDVIDYGSGEVMLTAEEISEIFLKNQAITAIDNHGPGWSGGYLIDYGPAWEIESAPMIVGSQVTAMSAAAIFNVLGKEVEMIPLRATDGDLVAHVTYYTAMGAGCESPELAYQFMREFLSEESQWEQNRTDPKPDEDGKRYFVGLIEEGWPVRCKGAAQYLWEHLKSGFTPPYPDPDEEQMRIYSDLKALQLADSDIPILDAPIDRVRFPLALEYNTLALSSNSLNANAIGYPTDVDINTLAEKVIQGLQWHVAEG